MSSLLKELNWMAYSEWIVNSFVSFILLCSNSCRLEPEHKFCMMNISIDLSFYYVPIPFAKNATKNKIESEVLLNGIWIAKEKGLHIFTISNPRLYIKFTISNFTWGLFTKDVLQN
jgi:hypothetical protein